MAGAIASLIVNVAANTAQLQQDVKKIDSTLSGFEASIGKVGKMLAGAFTVTAIVGLGKQVLDFAGNLVDLSKQTGINTTALQKWGMAFEQSGVGLETVTKAANELAIRLVSGDKGVVGALEKMGLKVSELRKMKPEDQFTTVADAVGKIQDQGEKLYASKTLFGKAGPEILKGLTGNLKETGDEFERMGMVMSEETVAAADEFGDKLGMLGKQLMALAGEVIGPLLPLLSMLADALMWLGKTIIGPLVGGAVKVVTTIFLGLWVAITDVLATLADLATKIPGVGKHLGFLGDAADWLKKSSTAAQEKITKLWTETEQTGKVAEYTTPKLLGLGEATAKTATAAEKAAAAARAFGAAWMKASPAMMEMTRANLGAGLGGGLFQGVLQNFMPATDPARLFGLSRNNGTFFQPASMVDISSRNGDLMGATGIFGGTASKPGFFGNLTGSITGNLKSMWDGMSGGKGISGLFSNIGSGLLSGGLNSLMSMATGLIGKGISKIGSFFKGLFGGGEGSKVNDMRDDFIAQNFGSSNNLRSEAARMGVSLDSFFKADKVKEFESAVAQLQTKMKSFNDQMAAGQDAQLQKQQMLNEALQAYGFTIEEMGPAMQQQKLAEQAETLLNHFKLLTESGINVDTVIARMSDQINAFVQIAMKTGTEVPNQMREMLEKMLEQGRLTDAAGEKLKSLEGIKFGETLEMQFSRVLEKLEQMIDAMNRLGGAAGNVGAAVGNIQMPRIVDTFAVGDVGTVAGKIPGFAGGSGGFRNFRRGTLAVLHGEEEVRTRAQAMASEGGVVAAIAGLERTMRQVIEEMPILMRDAMNTRVATRA